MAVDDRRDRLHFGQHLEPRLRLRRLGRLGPEAVDEGLQVLALILLLFLVLQQDGLLFAALLFKARIIAAPERELRRVEMQNMV